MGVYEKNIEALKRNRPFLYDTIQANNKSESSGEGIEVFSELTYNNEQTLYVKKNNKAYRMNSSYNPSYEADKWIKQFEFHEMNNTILMYGLGNGVFLRSIMKRLHKKDMALVYEPSVEIFLHDLKHYNFTDILSDERILVAVENCNDTEFHFTLREVINVTNINSVIICSHPYYNEIFDTSCVNFWKDIKDGYTSTIMNVNTEILFGEKFIDNILRNITFIKNNNSLPDIKSRIPNELPAIIVAAGPSVEKNIEELKQAKSKSVIFAVDRILDYLLDSGVEPDFVVTLDPAKPVEYFTRREDVSIPLITFMQTSHEILDKHQGKKIICNCSSFLNKAYLNNHKEVPATFSSASVATVAFTVCIELGFNTIILVGQDLAYNGKYSHAGSVEENCGDHNDVMVEDIHGKQIKSRYDWKQFVIWYQDVISFNKNLNVIDAKQEGAKIKGTTVMPLKEAVRKYSTGCFDSHEFMEQLEPTFNSDELQIVKEYLEDSMTMLNNIKKKSNEAIRKCDILIKEYKKNNSNSKTINDTVKKIGNINNYIRNQQLYSLIDKYLMSSSVQELSELYQFTGNVQEDNIRTYERARSVFQSIIQSLDFMEPRLKEAISNVL